MAGGVEPPLLGRVAIDHSKMKFRCTAAAVRRKSRLLATRLRNPHGVDVDELERIDSKENKSLGLSLTRYRTKQAAKNAADLRRWNRRTNTSAIVRANNRRRRKFAGLSMVGAERDVPDVVMGEMEVAMGREGEGVACGSMMGRESHEVPGNANLREDDAANEMEVEDVEGGDEESESSDEREVERATPGQPSPRSAPRVDIREAAAPPSTSRCAACPGCNDERSPAATMFQQLQKIMKTKTTEEKMGYFEEFGPSLFLSSSSIPRQLDATFEEAAAPPLSRPTYNNQRVSLDAVADGPPFDGTAFHYHRPDKSGKRGKHRAQGKPATFNLKEASRLGAKHAKKRVKMGFAGLDWKQKRETLYNLLLDPEFRYMYQTLRGEDDEEARVGKHILRSIQTLLPAVMRAASKKNNTVTKKQRQFLNCVCALVSACPASESGVSMRELGRHLGFSAGATQRNLSAGQQRAMAVLNGEEDGYELVEKEKQRTKFDSDFLKQFDNYIDSDCILVIDNPCKGDMVWKRDRQGRVVNDESTGEPVKVQKKYLMASYRELHLEMIASFPGMMDGDKVVMSESTLRRLMPPHVKKATPRTKQMCGCQSCTIIKEMYQCLKVWRRRYLLLQRKEVREMANGRAKERRTAELDRYESAIEDVPERAWDAASMLACPKLLVKDEEDAEDEGRRFHHFSCVMGECKDCPKWKSLVPKEELKTSLPIRYSVYSGYHTCSVHKEKFIATDATNKRKKYCTECAKLSEDELKKAKATVRKKYIRMKKSEPMKDFMKPGGTFMKYMQHMLYHSFLVEMLGSTVCGRMVENLVRANDFSMMLRRDHSERYTPRPNGEIQSEGLGMEDSVSIEGATLLYKVLGSEEFRKVLYCHISDDKKQNAATVLNNLLHLLDDLDKKKEMPRALLQHIFDIVDGCAVQYRCGTVLYSMALLAKRRGIRFTRCVQAPGHGKAEVDGLVGTEKTYCDTKFNRPAQLTENEIEEVDIWAELREPSTDSTPSETVDEYGRVAGKAAIAQVPIHKMEGGQKLSLAKSVYEILNDPARGFSQKYEKRKIKERRNHYRAVGSAKSHNLKMTAEGFEEGNRRGIGSHYCFMADHDLVMQLAARRFFCSCKACQRKLNLPLSERYAGPWNECKFWKIFRIDDNRGWNDVTMLSFERAKGCDEEELVESLAVATIDMGKQYSLSVVDGNYGAYGADDDDLPYYLVKWIGTPWQVEEDEVVEVDGEEVQLFAGEWVCKGIWLETVNGRSKIWYTVGDREVIVRMRTVFSTDLELIPFSAQSNPLPRGMPNKRIVETKNPLRLPAEEHDFLSDEAHRREDMDHEEEFVVDDSDGSDAEYATDEDEEGYDVDGISDDDESSSGGEGSDDDSSD